MIKSIFFTIGIISTVFIIIYLLSGSDKPENKASCMDGTIIFLSTRYINNNYYELIHRTTGFSDKVSFIQLYKDRRPSNKKCINTEKIISEHYLSHGPEHEPSIKWPVEINITNEEIKVKYTRDETKALNILNICPIWSEFNESNK